MSRIYNYTYSQIGDVWPLNWKPTTNEEIKKQTGYKFNEDVNIVFGYNDQLTEGIYSTAEDFYIGNEFNTLYRTNLNNVISKKNKTYLFVKKGKTTLATGTIPDYINLITLYDETNYINKQDTYDIYPYTSVAFYNLTNKKAILNSMSGEISQEIKDVEYIPYADLGKISINSNNYIGLPPGVRSVYIVGGEPGLSSDLDGEIHIYHKNRYYKTSLANIMEYQTSPNKVAYGIEISKEPNNFISLVVNPLFVEAPKYHSSKSNIDYYDDDITELSDINEYNNNYKNSNQDYNSDSDSNNSNFNHSFLLTIFLFVVFGLAIIAFVGFFILNRTLVFHY